MSNRDVRHDQEGRVEPTMTDRLAKCIQVMLDHLPPVTPRRVPMPGMMVVGEEPKWDPWWVRAAKNLLEEYKEARGECNPLS